MAKISAVVNTYNAEKYLDRVLQSLSRFDEIVVCDMESTDSTIEIAKKHGCKIVTFPKGNFTYVEPARNFAISHVSNEWILVVDSDELISNELREYLYNIIQTEKDLGGMFIPRKNFFMGKYMSCYYPDYILRFLRKEGCYWPETIHSLPTVKGRIEKIPRNRTDLAIIHLADDNMNDSISKLNKYTENERIRRASKYNFVQFFYAPFFKFFKTYVLKGGFKGGKQGFIHAMFDAFYHFTALAKMEEDRQAKLPHKDIKKYLD